MICVLCGVLFMFIAFENRVDLEVNSPISDALIIKSEFELIEDNIELIIIESISYEINDNRERLIEGELGIEELKETTYQTIKDQVEKIDGIRDVEEINNDILVVDMIRTRNFITISSTQEYNINNYFRDVGEQIEITRTNIESLNSFRTSITQCQQGDNYNGIICREEVQQRVNQINSKDFFCSLSGGDLSRISLECNSVKPPYFKHEIDILSVSRSESTAQIDRIEQGDLIRTGNRGEDIIFDFENLNFPEVEDGQTGYLIFYSYQSSSQFTNSITEFENLFLERVGELDAFVFNPEIDGEFLDEIQDEQDINTNGASIHSIRTFDINLNNENDFFVSTISSRNTPEFILNEFFDLENNEQLNIFIVDNKIHTESSIVNRGQMYTYPQSNPTTEIVEPTTGPR